MWPNNQRVETERVIFNPAAKVHVWLLPPPPPFFFSFLFSKSIHCPTTLFTDGWQTVNFWKAEMPRSGGRLNLTGALNRNVPPSHLNPLSAEPVSKHASVCRLEREIKVSMLIRLRKTLYCFSFTSLTLCLSVSQSPLLPPLPAPSLSQPEPDELYDLFQNVI